MADTCKKILVAEDSESMRLLYVEALALKGYSVDAAADGLEALDRLRESAYTLVITDIDMPRLNGIGLYMKAAEEFPHLKDRFFFISGCCSRETIALLNSLKKKYLIKPFKIAEFLDAVERLASRAAGKPSRTAEKRREERFNSHASCSIAEEGVHRNRRLDATVENLSRHGAMIDYSGELLIPHTPVNVSIELESLSLERQARVVWSRELKGDRGLTGLCFSEPIPLALASGGKQRARRTSHKLRRPEKEDRGA